MVSVSDEVVEKRLTRMFSPRGVDAAFEQKFIKEGVLGLAILQNRVKHSKTFFFNIRQLYI